MSVACTGLIGEIVSSDIAGDKPGVMVSLRLPTIVGSCPEPAFIT